MRSAPCRLSSRPPALISLSQPPQRLLARRPHRLDDLWCWAVRKEPQEPEPPGQRSAQELQAKAKVLLERQRQVAAELQQLQTEAENLSEADQQLVQAQLSSQQEDAGEQQLPGPIRDLFAEAGVLDAFPNDPSSRNDDSDAYFRTPGDAQSYDWDLTMDTLDDVAESRPGESVDQEGLGASSSAREDEEDEDDAEGESAGSNEEFEAGAGVEEMLRLLEEGGALPDIEGLMDAEDPQEFQMRVQKLIDRYEAQFQKKKDRKISTEEIREMEREEAWQPTKRVPVVDEDITEVRPAPAIPADIQQQYDALQQCLYVLRRAHLTGRADEPVKALASAGLVDMLEVHFEDPLIACTGLQPWLLYMEGLRSAGAWTQAELLWAEVSDDRPNPVYTITVDQFVNLPFPEWYYAEFQDSAPASAWDQHTGALRVPALLAVHESAPDDPSVPLQRAYPRPQDPQRAQPTGKPTGQPKQAGAGSGNPAIATTAEQGYRDSDQQDQFSLNGSSATGDAAADDAAHQSTRNRGSAASADASAADATDFNSSSSSSDATINAEWGFKRGRPPGYRQAPGPTGAQTIKGRQAGSVALDEEEAGLQEWPCFCYPPEQLRGRIRDSEFADQQRSVLEQILQETQQQGSSGVTAASQDAQDTSTANSDQTSDPQTTFKMKEASQSDSLAQKAEQDVAEPAANAFLANTQDAAAPGYLPNLDLLAQFSETNGSGADDVPDVLDEADAAEDAAASPKTSPAESPPAGSSQGPTDTAEEESSMVLNLNGAQVLTPEGWESVTSKTPLGTPWEQGNCLTIGMTLQYHLFATSGKITAVTCGWATVDAFAWTTQDMMDLYIRCTGLHKF